MNANVGRARDMHKLDAVVTRSTVGHLDIAIRKCSTLPEAIIKKPRVVRVDHTGKPSKVVVAAPWR